MTILVLVMLLALILLLASLFVGFTLGVASVMRRLPPEVAKRIRAGESWKNGRS